MTRAEILAMQPGPKLDNELAPLLGYTVEHFIWKYDDLEKPCTIWKTAAGESVNPKPLSTIWEGMGLVVEAMRAKGWDLDLDIFARSTSGKFARAFFHHEETKQTTQDVGRATAPHAVALAALLALEGER